MNNMELWQRYKKYLCAIESFGLRVDISRMNFDDRFFNTMAEPMGRALKAMESLEHGVIANQDEGRMVGHYWLRAPELAPDKAIRAQIEQTLKDIKRFAADVQNGTIAPQRSDAFYVVLVVGIGGSALGAQFVCDALGTVNDPMIVRFIDNTDPNGIDRTLEELTDNLEQTLTVVISKSGTTVETYNGMLELRAAYQRAGLRFAKHAVAITCEGSKLHQQAESEQWLHIFPMWDWVGGRTSVLSAAGLVPIALQGIEIDGLLAGAKECDVATRSTDMMHNPAALISLMWFVAGDGVGKRNMVVLPYRDRLLLLGRYLQQLIMESLGKEVDRSGAVVHQGLTVYGNKGSTDQHAFVQQLREGPDDFFVTFIDVLRDRDGASISVAEDVTSGDFLKGFLLGTRAALYEKGRQSVTITLEQMNARSVSILVALFERAVGLYAELTNINAYHQPGVEAGKKAAAGIIDLQRRILDVLHKQKGTELDAAQIAEAIGAAEAVESVYHLLEHLAANPDRKVVKVNPSATCDTAYKMLSSDQ